MRVQYSSKAGLLVVATLLVGGVAWNAVPVGGFQDVDRQVVFGVAAIAAGQTARLNVVLDNPNICPPTPVELMFVDADGNVEQRQTVLVESGHAVYSDLSFRPGPISGGDAVGDTSRHRFRAAARFVDDPNIRARCRGAEGTATVEVIDDATGKTENFLDSPAAKVAGWGPNHNETLVRDETPR